MDHFTIHTWINNQKWKMFTEHFTETRPQSAYLQKKKSLKSNYWQPCRVTRLKSLKIQGNKKVNWISRNQKGAVYNYNIPVCPKKGAPSLNFFYLSQSGDVVPLDRIAPVFPPGVPLFDKLFVETQRWNRSKFCSEQPLTKWESLPVMGMLLLKNNIITVLLRE